MPLTNITATLTSGVQVVSTANTLAAGVTATASNECLSLTVAGAINANNAAGAKAELFDCIVKIGAVNNALTYGTGTLAQMSITRTQVLWSITSIRQNILLTKIIDSTIRSTNTGGPAFVYTQAGNQAVLDGVVFDGIYVHEIAGPPATFNNVKYRNCGLNFLNWGVGNLTLTAVDIGSGTSVCNTYTGADGQSYDTFDAWIGKGNSANRLTFVDSAVNMSKIAIELVPAAGTEMCFKKFTRTDLYLVNGVALNGANVRFTPTASSGWSSQAAFDRTINVTGYLVNGATEEKTVNLLVQTAVVSGTSRSTGLVSPTTVSNFSLKNISWSRRIRRADILELVTDVTPTEKTGTVAAPVRVEAVIDAAFTGTVDQAAAIAGVVFTVTNSLVTVTVTSAQTAQDIYSAWKHWTSQHSQFSTTQSLILITNGVLEITGSMTTSAAVSAGGNAAAIKTTGTITTTGGGVISLPAEDADGVRVTIAKRGGGTFNIFARHGTTGAYTELGFSENVDSVTYIVPKGRVVEYSMAALGFVTYVGSISTASGGVAVEAPMVSNPNINTTIDVSAYLASITASVDVSGPTPFFVITFDAPMTVPSLETGKAIIHRLVQREIALRANLPPGNATTIAIVADEITNFLPSIRLAVGAGVSATQKVYLDFFINTDAALALNPAYVINPVRADGNQVQMLRIKPALDPARITAGVWAAPERTLTFGGGGGGGATLAEIEASSVFAKQATLTALATANQAEHDATQTAIAALPVPLNNTQTQAAAAAALAVYDAVVPADLANLATAGNVTAAQTAIVAEVNANEAKINAIPTNPLLATNYTAPDNAGIAVIRAKTDTLVNGPTLEQIDASVSTRASQSSVTAFVTANQAEHDATQNAIAAISVGLTHGQAEQLRKVAQLHGVGATLVVTETTRTAGDIAQIVSTDEAGNTTVSAA